MGRKKIAPELIEERLQKLYPKKPAISEAESIAIRFRFLEAVEYLMSVGGVKSYTELSVRLEMNYNSFKRFKKEPEKHQIDVMYYARLSQYYNVSPIWILTGRGVMIEAE